MTAEQNDFRAPEVTPEVPSEEELAFIDEAADEAVHTPVDENAQTTLENTDQADLARPDKPKRPKRVYDPKRDGPAITSDDFDELMPRFTAPLTRFLAMRTSSPDIAEEYAQEAFVRAYVSVAKRGALIPMKLASAWLFRIAENLANDYFRRKRLIGWVSLNEPVSTNDGKPGETLADTLPANTSGDDLPKMIDDQQAVRAVLAWMPQYMQAHILYENEGVTPTERAAMIGVKPTAMNMQAARAREVFRQGFRHYQAHGRVPARTFRDIETDGTKLRYFTPQQRELGYLADISADLQPDH